MNILSVCYNTGVVQIFDLWTADRIPVRIERKLQGE